ncbi:TPA: hypothetical protein ACJGSF_003184 [Salmonella enterica subsp. enterica serovar Muenchen]
MNKNTVNRSCTAGIPDFVPRKSTTDATHHSQAESTYYIPDIPEQTLPPVTPCFSQADIDAFLARKPEKYKMTERDYKELGKNVLLGIADFIAGTATTAIFGGIVIAEVITETPVKPLSEDNYYTWDGYHYTWHD